MSPPPGPRKDRPNLDTLWPWKRSYALTAFLAILIAGSVLVFIAMRILFIPGLTFSIQPAAVSPAAGLPRLTLDQANALILAWYRQEKPDPNPQVTAPLKEMTTAEIWNRLGVQVFQVSADSFMFDTFLVTGSQVTPLGIGFGGMSVTSLAVTDLDQDGQPELLYTYSFGSGIHQSRLGAWSPVFTGSSIIEAGTTLIFGDFLLEKVSDRQVRVKAEMSGRGSVTIGRVALERQSGRETLKLELDQNLPQEIQDNLKTVVGPVTFYPTATP